MKNMKKILFGLGSVTAVVAPVAAAVACGSDDKDTDLRGDWTVKNATELENLFKKLGGNDNAYVNDFPGLFTVLSNGTSKAELTVYQSTKVSNDWAIVAKGNTVEVADNSGFAQTVITTDFDVNKQADLKDAAYVVIVKGWKVDLHEVQVTPAGEIGLSTADKTFSVN